MRAAATQALAGAGKRVMIVCQLDGFANGERARHLHEFLGNRGHEVRLVDTAYLGRASDRLRSFRSKAPPLSVMRLGLYLLEVVSRLLTRRWRWGRRHLSHYLLAADCRLRKQILSSAHPLDDFDLVICLTPYDAGILTAPTSARTWYDCPTPWADELWYEGRLTGRQHHRLRRVETELFERVDHLSFHWQTYGGYAMKHYGITGRNLVNLNWGCVPLRRRARFKSPARVVYLGSLSSQFIDLRLLSRLARLYDHIDVYGGPPPDPRLGLNYLGYASEEVLESYQFGLVTCTRDELRRDGFSAKHLSYMSCGLPVLVPAWRRHLQLLRGSVPYEEQSFVSVIAALSDSEAWQRVSDEAYDQAQRLAYPLTLAPLDAVLREA